MGTSLAGAHRFRRGKRGFAFNRTLQAESLKARLLLSGSSVPRPTDLTTAALIASAAGVQPVLTKITVSPASASIDCYATQQFTAVGLDQSRQSSGRPAGVHLEGQLGQDYVCGCVHPCCPNGQRHDYGGQRLDSRQHRGQRFRLPTYAGDGAQCNAQHCDWQDGVALRSGRVRRRRGKTSLHVVGNNAPEGRAAREVQRKRQQRRQA